MFEYDLTGKQVVLVLDEEVLPALKSLGVLGSPLLGRVHRMEESGIWLENPSFSICPVGTRKLYAPTGEAMCLAHVFIHSRSIVSMAVFPSEVEALEKDPNLHKIGFTPELQPGSERRSGRRR